LKTIIRLNFFSNANLVMQLLKSSLFLGTVLTSYVVAITTRSAGQIDVTTSATALAVSLCNDEVVTPADVRQCRDKYAALGGEIVSIAAGAATELCKVGSIKVTASSRHGDDVKASEVTNGIGTILIGCPTHGGSIPVGEHGDVLIEVKRNAGECLMKTWSRDP
jgi:hypothetical protein